MDSTQILALIQRLRDRGQKLCFAESCTGGLLSARVVAEPGVSDIYMGSLVVYSYRAKSQLLGVRPQSLEQFGAVSEPVVRQMAQGAIQAFDAQWSVAITGIAGPSGGTEQKPVGTVWFGLVGPQLELVEKRQFFGSRTEIQMQSAEFALSWLNQVTLVA